MKKKLVAVICALSVVLLVVVSLIVVQTVRNRRPPALEEVRERVELLLLASGDVNEMLWGEGLPIYPRVEREILYVEYGEEKDRLYYYTFPDEEHGTVLAYQYWVREVLEGDTVFTYTDVERGGIITVDENFQQYRYARASKEAAEGYLCYSEVTGNYYYPLEDFTAEDEPRYYTSADDADYDYVRVDCGYLSTTDMQNEVAKIYSAAICDEIEEAIFIGVAAFDWENGISYPRYQDLKSDEGTYSLGKINKNWKPFPIITWEYDFSTLQMVKPSNSKSITISVACHPKGSPDQREVKQITFVLENGQWYLDDYTR